MGTHEFRHNHYVPVWYQKRFISPQQQDRELFYLDLHPGTFRDSRGVAHPHKAVRKLGFKYCFAEHDLYTRRFGTQESTRMEQLFFGRIDEQGKSAVEYFAGFQHPSVNGEAFNDLMRYMSTQKLRTPKGLGWLKQVARTDDREEVLHLVVEYQQVHCVIWTECVWAIVDAESSDTKFLVSDHPVTIYNRRCGPRSQWCRDARDPDIWLHGTHTIFPLSWDKALILTNLSWVRNPYQSEVAARPNPALFRNTVFNFLSIQTRRSLREEEVRQINFIIKERAHRYIGAAREEWLYPERHVSRSDWATYGRGYLLMPDPRSVTYTTGVVFGYEGGGGSAFDEYGRRPWERGYRGDRDGPQPDWYTFLRFQGEFARLFGPYRRGRAYEVGGLDKECDDEDFHRYHLSLEAHGRKHGRR